MKMRMPSIPLITIDPYFSVWTDNINSKPTTHWTAAENNIVGYLSIDGKVYRFLGDDDNKSIEKMNVVSVDANAFTTTVIYEDAGIRVKAEFTSPMLVTELYYASRPVSYLKLSYEALDGAEHNVTAKIYVSEELVLNKAGEGRAYSEPVEIEGLSCVRIGSGDQKVLWRSGDDVRIDWGYCYLAAEGEAKTGNAVIEGLYAVYAETEIKNEKLFLFAYDDIDSMVYFGDHIKAYWKKDGKTIEEAIKEAAAEYDELLAKCNAFSDKIQSEATTKGGEKYAEMLLLAYRQVMAAHKLVVDNEGNNLYISKECFSNGCAATVDVTYPSAPMYLLYNTELLKGMLRPIFRYAASDDWKFDFAPHDVGQYPLVNGQVYGNNELRWQMPVEECGNMIILVSAISKADGDYSFAEENFGLLEKWSKYLIKYGKDPEHQLCTDDFAGHLAHNCNLSLKAIMGIAGFADILRNLGKENEADELLSIAKDYSDSFIRNAENPDGSYRLAYDREGTFSLKYNSVWDKIWETELFPESFYKAEIERYKKEALPYGVPLDSREKYTKSDWLVWVATLADNKDDFEFFADLLWNAYNTMRTRVPMTDWYYTDTSEMVGFRHRTVQGGLFIRLMLD
ncbi:MAG: DUF4965 domain-containing protein [Acutalibacteraceae bacterium]|nr:DUF4965 domain-containing protein [Acutalibacteraceae bacterium]